MLYSASCPAVDHGLFCKEAHILASHLLRAAQEGQDSFNHFQGWKIAVVDMVNTVLNVQQGGCRPGHPSTEPNESLFCSTNKGRPAVVLRAKRDESPFTLGDCAPVESDTKVSTVRGGADNACGMGRLVPAAETATVHTKRSARARSGMTRALDGDPSKEACSGNV
jgi:hypothetical protein